MVVHCAMIMALIGFLNVVIQSYRTVDMRTATIRQQLEDSNSLVEKYICYRYAVLLIIKCRLESSYLAHSAPAPGTSLGNTVCVSP